jgi:hypothetical protein
MAEIDRGMELPDLKRLLTKSKTEPVNVAVGMSGKNAVMMLHKMKQPKAVCKDLEAKFKDLKTQRWGTAFVDIDEDPKLVVLTLNRGGGGLGKKLKKTLMGSGFSKVRIQLEDGTIDEDIKEEEEEGEEQAGNEPPPAPWNPAELTARLTDLVKQMVGVAKSAPDRVGELKDLATKAQTAIKTGVENAATEAVDAFASALAVVNQGLASVSGANGGPAPNPTVLAKSGLAWAAALKRVQDDFGKLQQAMVQHYDGKPFATELEKLLQAKVTPIITTLDQALASKLEDAGKSTDGAEQQKLLGEARQMIGQYESFVTGNDLLAQLDANPFVPLQTQKTLVATLGALKKSVG